MSSALRKGVDQFIPTRNTLLSRLRDWDDHESWRVFFDTYWRFLYSIACRCGLSNEDARDVVQETVVGAAKALREGRFVRTASGSFKGWLQLMVRRRVADQAGLDHVQRADNLERAMQVQPRWRASIHGVATLLVDDVLTTGATLMEAARALSAGGASHVAAATVAATQRRGIPA